MPAMYTERIGTNVDQVIFPVMVQRISLLMVSIIDADRFYAAIRPSYASLPVRLTACGGRCVPKILCVIFHEVSLGHYSHKLAMVSDMTTDM
jgi:hypothetical protein